jgi:hypothetical protein
MVGIDVGLFVGFPVGLPEGFAVGGAIITIESTDVIFIIAPSFSMWL